MLIDRDIESWLRLGLVKGLGGGAIRKLLTAFGSPDEIFATDIHSLERVVKKPIAVRIFQHEIDEDRFAKTIDWLADPANALITLSDPDYPGALLNIPDPPPILYFKGQRRLLTLPALAMVGSRNATPQGMANAKAFAEAASQAGFCIVSGLAQGIDAAVHEGGLRGTGSSMAVIGTGMDIVYPARNHVLAHRLAKEGALISEFPLGTPAIGSNFPRRNRIISGLCQACLVVEATLYSGSLITARLALEQGREVMAIPGSIHSPLSKGCHALIKQGAKLIENIQDILDELNCVPERIADTLQTDLEQENTVDHAHNDSALLTCLGHDATDIDTLCERSGLTAEVVSATLLMLELEGKIGSLPGGRYQRIS